MNGRAHFVFREQRCWLSLRGWEGETNSRQGQGESHSKREKDHRTVAGVSGSSPANGREHRATATLSGDSFHVRLVGGSRSAGLASQHSRSICLSILPRSHGHWRTRLPNLPSQHLPGPLSGQQATPNCVDLARVTCNIQKRERAREGLTPVLKAACSHISGIFTQRNINRPACNRNACGKLSQAQR